MSIESLKWINRAKLDIGEIQDEYRRKQLSVTDRLIMTVVKILFAIYYKE